MNYKILIINKETLKKEIGLCDFVFSNKEDALIAIESYESLLGLSHSFKIVKER